MKNWAESALSFHLAEGDKRIAVVSGGAAEELEEAIGKEVDCYITGEPSHINYHPALEAKINVIYAGHYYTEKPGVQALGKAITDRFGIETVLWIFQQLSNLDCPKIPTHSTVLFPLGVGIGIGIDVLFPALLDYCQPDKTLNVNPAIPVYCDY